MKLSQGQWQVAFGVVAAVCTYLLLQTEIDLNPVIRVALGAINVGLAVLQPKGSPLQVEVTQPVAVTAVAESTVTDVAGGDQ